MSKSKKDWIGVDTPLLVAQALEEHPNHQRANAIIDHLLSENRFLAICPAVTEEFLHMMTDARRFEHPLSIGAALDIIKTWMNGRETVLLTPTQTSWRLQQDWIREHRLGRKRIHDTGIASTYHHYSIETIVTGNPRDYGIFGCFKIIDIGRETDIHHK